MADVIWGIASIVIAMVAVLLFGSRRETKNETGDEQQTMPVGRRGVVLDFLSDWWGDNESINSDGRKMLFYFTLFIITVFTYFLSGNFKKAGIVVLIGFLIIWITSFFLFPKEKMSGVTKIVIFGTFAFFVFAGIFPNTATKWWGNIEYWHAGVESGKSSENVREIAPVEAKVEVVPLTTEWVSFIPLIPGKDTLFECLESGGKMKITFTSGKETAIKSGEVIHCPLTGEKFWAGNGLVGAVYSFRNDTGKINELHIYNAKKL